MCISVHLYFRVYSSNTYQKVSTTSYETQRFVADDTNTAVAHLSVYNCFCCCITVSSRPLCKIRKDPRTLELHHVSGVSHCAHCLYRSHQNIEVVVVFLPQRVTLAYFWPLRAPNSTTAGEPIYFLFILRGRAEAAEEPSFFHLRSLFLWAIFFLVLPTSTSCRRACTASTTTQRNQPCTKQQNKYVPTRA